MELYYKLRAYLSRFVYVYGEVVSPSEKCLKGLNNYFLQEVME